MVIMKKMLLIQTSVMTLLLGLSLAPLNHAATLQQALRDAPRYNVSYSNENQNPSGLASLFSPRMDFEQWKPLTGRGDPLRNDPTYDYEPPVLKRVHYWAEDTRLEREHYPEKKSEVLMLGVSSRKPSVTSRQPPLPPKRQQYNPSPLKYEDFTYKLSDTYPLTILVPPPLPPPGYQPSLFVLHQEKIPSLDAHVKVTVAPQHILKDITTPQEKLSSSFALQEANLIYQSSSTIQNWIRDSNQSASPHINNVVSSDYAGWGPTTPLNEYDSTNETHNLILNDHLESAKYPYTFYKPMLSEAPPPPPSNNRIPPPTFLPTSLPATAELEEATESLSQVTWPTEPTTFEPTTKVPDYIFEDTTTDKPTTDVFLPTPATREPIQKPEPASNLLFDMLSPMMSMPIVNGPDRPEDNLYAHASENMQVFKEINPEDIMKLENMQTMQPPPPVMYPESTTVSHKQPYHANSNGVDTSLHKLSLDTYDPYLHMRYTTPVSPITSTDALDINKTPTEVTVPYLIIQGHSKVKTYGSKPKPRDDIDTLDNEIPKPNETNEVKHLHPIKEKLVKKFNISEGNHKSRAKNLKTLVDHGHGSIEIQETDIGIKYDVSDGSDVPLELYRKGIVDSDENDYKPRAETHKQKRIKRQIDLAGLITFDTIEEFLYDFLVGKKNETSFTGLLAQAVTSDTADAVDEPEEEDEEDIEEDQNHENEDR